MPQQKAAKNAKADKGPFPPLSRSERAALDRSAIVIQRRADVLERLEATLPKCMERSAFFHVQYSLWRLAKACRDIDEFIAHELRECCRIDDDVTVRSAVAGRKALPSEPNQLPSTQLRLTEES